VRPLEADGDVTLATMAGAIESDDAADLGIEGSTEVGTP